MFKRCQMFVNFILVPLTATVGLALGGCEPSVSRQQNGFEPTSKVSMDMPIVVGTYTGSVNGAGVDASKGLYTVSFDAAGDQLGQPELAAPIENPSFVAIDADKRRLYVASETKVGQVAAYQWSADFTQLSHINTVSSEGAYPCYVALNPDKTQLAVANYVTGNIAVYELDPVSGSIGENPQQRQHSGQGPNRQRQEGPHAHWVQWDPKAQFLYVVDLGIDQVVGYPVNSESGTLGEGFTALNASAGSGPRHMVFHPHKNLVYILKELSNTIVVARQESDGTLVAQQTLSTLPEDYSGHSQGAHIEMSSDGKTLYASNRGHNSIAVFDVAEEGQLEPVQWISTEGDWPRHFTLLPESKALLVANERSHRIVAFHIGDDGQLSSSGKSVDVAQPVFLGSLTGTGL